MIASFLRWLVSILENINQTNLNICLEDGAYFSHKLRDDVYWYREDDSAVVFHIYAVKCLEVT